MSATTPGVAQPRTGPAYDGHATAARASTETKASFKTTEFFVYIAIVVAILIAGAVTKAGSNHNDVFRASQVWLYVTILSIGYMISRGLAKAGSREPYREDH